MREDKQAHKLANKRYQEKPKSVKMTDEVKQLIKRELEAHRGSPEQIVGRLKLKYQISLHPETIYRYIRQDKKDDREIFLNLKRKSKPYRKRYGSTTNSSHGIPNRVDIDKRPKL